MWVPLHYERFEYKRKEHGQEVERGTKATKLSHGDVGKMAESLEQSWAADDGGVSLTFAPDEAAPELDKSQKKLGDLLETELEEPNASAFDASGGTSARRSANAKAASASKACSSAAPLVHVKVEPGVPGTTPSEPDKKTRKFDADVTRVVTKRKHNSELLIQWRSTNRLTDELRDTLASTKSDIAFERVRLKQASATASPAALPVEQRVAIEEELKTQACRFPAA